MKVDVIVERAGDNWCAYAPDLADVVVATGATREETIGRFREALRGLMEYKRDEGQPMPDVTELEIRETVAA
ncbi:MAG: type II toxin-antitoxin system HicB family antitoxin [Armatimonadetes bacterium]|nr:type II toxin-antitoxin system HicB family antitoxin [Armatimonadota bacterium]